MLFVKKMLAFCALAAVLLVSGCSKEPGPGGQASIVGKVYAQDYNNNGTILLGEYYVADADVYIIYGDDATYSDRVKTAPDGTFRFQFLNKGKYRIYTYSKDYTSLSGTVAVYAEVEITDKKQEVTLEDMVIKK